jgi:REP element-mobilizing transposase RayT
MPRGLHRSYGAHHLHFITCSCYHRLPFLRTARCRDRLLSILEQTRRCYRFVVVGYVVMPEHIHLLITEPEVGTLSTVVYELQASLRDAVLIWRDDPALEAPGYFQMSLAGQNSIPWCSPFENREGWGSL